MKKIIYDVDQVLKHNRDGSFETQITRAEILRAFAKTTGKANKKLVLKGLKPKHITQAVESWKEQNLSPATIKNRVAHLRWLAGKINKQNIIPRTNAELGIANRVYKDNSVNKAKDIDELKLAKLNERQALSVRLQREFGLRREESLKFKPSYADNGDKIILRANWCKGGRPREIPVRTDSQRKLLNECHNLVKNKSLIPNESNYIKARMLLSKTCENSDIKNMHGFRHAYAQERFLELAGFECPKNGGPIFKEMTQEQKQTDEVARLQVSKELGHNRIQITVNYLGR